MTGVWNAGAEWRPRHWGLARDAGGQQPDCLPHRSATLFRPFLLPSITYCCCSSVQRGCKGVVPLLFTMATS